MKLYLSSRLTHNCEEAKQYLFNWQSKHGADVAMITDGRDFFPPQQRESGIRNNGILLQKLGFNPTPIALKEYVGQYDKLKQFLSQFPTLHIIGGNPFMLKDSMDISLFTEFLKEQELNDDILYSGSSASTMLVGQIMLEHPSDRIMQNLGGAKSATQGLGYLDYTPIPHYPYLEPFESLKEVADDFEKKNLPYKVLADGEVIVKDTITNSEYLITERGAYEQ